MTRRGPQVALSPGLLAMMVLPPLLWAGNAVVGRAMAGQVPPLLLNALRWALALLVLLPLGWRALATREARAQVAARWRPLARLGLFGVGAYNALQYAALTTSTPVTVTLIAASTPAWMLAFGALLYRERPTRASLLGAALSLAGVAVVLGRGDLAALARVRFVAGDLLMLVAVASWALYSWQLARPHPLLAGEQRPAWGWAEFLLVQTLFGCVWAFAAAGVEALVLDPHPVRWSPQVLAALAYIAVGPSVLAYFCYGQAVVRAGPALASFAANLAPLFAALLSAALLREAPQPFHALAFVLIVAGIAVSARR